MTLWSVFHWCMLDEDATVVFEMLIGQRTLEWRADGGGRDGEDDECGGETPFPL